MFNYKQFHFKFVHCLEWILTAFRVDLALHCRGKLPIENELSNSTVVILSVMNERYIYETTDTKITTEYGKKTHPTSRTLLVFFSVPISKWHTHTFTNGEHMKNECCFLCWYGLWVSNGLWLYVWVCVFDLQMNAFDMWWLAFMNYSLTLPIH